MTDMYDIIVYGATSYTGQFICEELAKQCAETANVSWAVAGCCNIKLEELLATVADETGYTFVKKIPIILANVEDPTSLLAMVKQATLVINCVTPYISYGEEVVKACLEGEAHYLDLSDESYFLELMQLKYNAEAKDKGIYVIGALGFDSMTAEVGMKYTHEQFPMRLNDVEAFVEFKGKPLPKIHFDTFESFVNSYAHTSEVDEIRKKLCLKALPRPLHIQKSRGLLFYEPTVSSWCVPFIGNGRNVVFRSQQQLYQSKDIPKAVQFRPYLCVPNFIIGWMLLLYGVILGLFISFGLTRALMLKCYRFFSFGLVSKEEPTKAVIHNSSFATTFIGRGHKIPIKLLDGQTEAPTNVTMVTRLTGPNAGYITTSKCIVQAAITLLNERAKMPNEGGVYAPGAAFWKTTLYKRLVEQGFILETIPEAQVEAEKKTN